MAHGSRDHSRFDPLVAELRDGVTTFAMDRQGFGASGDAARYSIERGFEDVTAVVDPVAAGTGGPVALRDHSYSANCAMGGAALTTRCITSCSTNRVLGLAYPAGPIEAVEEALAAGDREAAIVLVFERHRGLLDGVTGCR